MSDAINPASFTQSVDPKSILKFILPLLLIPLILISVNAYGHIAGDIIIGLIFFISIFFFTKTHQERRLMLVMAIFAIIFETANVAIGLYKYIFTIQIPVWVGIGWGVLGLYVYKNLDLTRKINLKNSILLSIVLFVVIWLLLGFSLTGSNGFVALLVLIGTVYVLSFSSTFPHAMYLHMALMGILIEFLGTYLGVWTYYDPATNLAVATPLLGAGAAYASAMAFCIWISKLE